MSHAYLDDARFWRLLYDIDCDQAEEVRAGGCPHCGGVLHSARYPRKPRGTQRSLLGEMYGRRESLCCSREGCRRRRTPGSVRFLGRRVYLGAWVVLVSALSEALPAAGRARAAARFGVGEHTLRRWRRWWRVVFPSTALWRSSRGGFVPPVSNSGLPGALASRFGSLEAQKTMVAVLCFVRPVSLVEAGGEVHAH